LSVPPTLRFLSWKRQARADTAFAVPAAELASVCGYLRAEMMFFMLIPIFAAAMARGYGQF
jgi:putative membrane protein